MAGFLLLVLGLAGCATANTREARFGFISGRARLKAGQATYYQLDLRRPLDPLAPRVLLRLPDGRVLSRTNFNYRTLKEAGFLGKDSEDYNPANFYSHELSRYGASFYFDKGTLILIRLTETTGSAVAFAGERKPVYRTLPLSQEDLEKLFGKPEKTADKFQL